MINYTVQYRLQGSTAWKNVTGFQRPIMYSEKIDETLDFGQLVLQATEMLVLPPFTQIAITMTDDAGTTKKLYAVVGTPTKQMVRST